MRKNNAIVVLLATLMMTNMTLLGAYSHERVINPKDQYVDLSADAEFRGCSSKESGGAINNSGDIVGLDGGIFSNNSADNYGGAIYNSQSGTLSNIYNSVFTNNHAKSSGGAIYNVGAFSYVENSEFINNYVAGDSSVGAGYGGAIYTNKTLNIHNSIFTGNRANRNGGAIAVMNGNLNIYADGDGEGAVTKFSDNKGGAKANDIYMGSSETGKKQQVLNIAAMNDNDSVIIGSGIDFNKALTININSIGSSTGVGTVYLTGNVGSADKRATLNLFGGTLSFSDGDINKVYAGTVSLSGESDTRLEFDINVDGTPTYDIFNFNSIKGKNYLVLDSNSFNIEGHGFLDDEKSVIVNLITSSSSFKSHILMYDENGNKTSVVFKRDDSGNLIYKIRLRSDGTFVISDPYYIDQVSNPLAYAVNYLCSSETIKSEYTLDIGKKNITIDSWEEVPENSRINIGRNQRPTVLTIKGKNKSITAIDNIEGMIVPVGKKLTTSGVSFVGFNNAITNDGGNVNIEKTGFKNNLNEADNGYGSAISNLSGTMEIKGTTKNNKTVFQGNKSTNGGAVYNSGDLTMEYVTFGGKVTKKKSLANEATEDGGAIYNELETGVLNVKNSTFKNNQAKNGGAVANANEGHYITDNAVYTSNKAVGIEDSEGNLDGGKGGAIYNNGGVVTINGGKFTSNTADIGGAIYNDADSVIELDAYTYYDKKNNKKQKETVFSGNISKSGKGGAIYNLGTITPVLGDKDGYQVPTSLAGTFTKNKVTIADQKIKTTYSHRDDETIYESPMGGAIYNEGSLDIAFSTLTSNSANSKVIISVEGYPSGSYYVTEQITRYSGKGGAIYSNSAEDLYITNSTVGKNTAAEAGGAIYNENADSSVYITNSNFYSNSSKSLVTSVEYVSKQNDAGKKVKKTTTKNYVGKGGAVYSAGNVYVNAGDNLTVKLNEDAESVVEGDNVIITNAEIKVDDSAEEPKYQIIDSKTNYESSDNYYNMGNTGFEYGTVFKSNSSVYGGAIYSEKDVNLRNVNFSNNNATEDGGAIYAEGNVNINVDNYHGLTTEDGNPVFVRYSAEGVDPVDIEVTPTIGTAVFTSNRAKNGGAIYSGGKTFIKDAVFNSNKASEKGGAIYTTGDMLTYNTVFSKNSAQYGGAVYVSEGAKAFFIDTDFLNNNASKEGGAIYADEGSELLVAACNRDVLISGNKAGGKANSIYLNNAVLNVFARALEDGTRYSVTINDGITGNEGGTSEVVLYGGGILNIDQRICSNVRFSDGHSESEFYSNVIPFSILNIKLEDLIKNCSLNLRGRMGLGLSNNHIGTLALDNLTLADGTTTNLSIDIDPKNGLSDKITANNVEGTGILDVSGITLTSNVKKSTTVDVGEDSLVNTISATTAETDEATYKVETVLREGRAVARIFGQKAKPCVLAAPVAAQLGGYLTQINSYDQAFANMDMEMLLTREEREANRTALARDNVYKTSCGNDVNINLSCARETNNVISDCAKDSHSIVLGYDSVSYDNGINRDGKGLWTRPYASFEKVNLNHGPNVSSISYGNFFGGDAELKRLSNGWMRRFSAYVGYNGSTQDYDGQSIDQNGGTFGIMESWYKGNFFTAVTANASGNSVNAQTDLGHENFPMLMAGVASKTGYNFEFKRGKYIIQPALLLSYSFVHTFSHENGKGTHIGSSPLHAIQVAPGVKFIANLKNGWQPYLGVNMRWNILDKTHFSMQDVGIPDMSIDPYIEYGLGLQKRWGDRFTGFGQAMVRNGGRNGVMLSFGFKWSIGK